MHAADAKGTGSSLRRWLYAEEQWTLGYLTLHECEVLAYYRNDLCHCVLIEWSNSTHLIEAGLAKHGGEKRSCEPK